MTKSSSKSREWVKKLWGQEEVIVNNYSYCGKMLWLNLGYVSSLHYHGNKSETFMCISGKAMVEIQADDIQYTVELDSRGRESIDIPAGVSHRFWALSEGTCLVEFSTPHKDEDTYRISESKPITPTSPTIQ